MQEYKILSDRQKIKDVLQNYIDPLATDTQPPWLLNVVTGPHARSMPMNISILDENRCQNLNLDGQPASTRR